MENGYFFSLDQSSRPRKGFVAFRYSGVTKEAEKPIYVVIREKSVEFYFSGAHANTGGLANSADDTGMRYAHTSIFKLPINPESDAEMTSRLTEILISHYPLHEQYSIAPPSGYADLEANRARALGESLLGVDCIADWFGFLENLKKRKFGERIWAQLPVKCRTLIEKALSSQSLQEYDKFRIIRQLNLILSRSNFYSSNDFADVELPEEIQSLLARKREDLASSEIQLLNRLFLESAYPKEISKLPKSPKIAYARLVLDLLFDIEHSSVFKRSPNYELFIHAVKNNLLLSAISTRAKYYYDRREYLKQADNCQEPIKGLVTATLVESEAAWLSVLQKANSADRPNIFETGWFYGLEQEYRNVVLAYNWLHSTYQKVSYILQDFLLFFRLTPKESWANDGFKHESWANDGFKRDQWTKTLRGHITDPKFAEIKGGFKEAAKWFIRRYDVWSTLGSLGQGRRLFLVLSLVLGFIAISLSVCYWNEDLAWFEKLVRSLVYYVAWVFLSLLLWVISLIAKPKEFAKTVRIKEDFTLSNMWFSLGELGQWRLLFLVLSLVLGLIAIPLIVCYWNEDLTWFENLVRSLVYYIAWVCLSLLMWATSLVLRVKDFELSILGLAMPRMMVAIVTTWLVSFSWGNSVDLSFPEHLAIVLLLTPLGIFVALEMRNAMPDLRPLSYFRPLWVISIGVFMSLVLGIVLGHFFGVDSVRKNSQFKTFIEDALVEGKLRENIKAETSAFAELDEAGKKRVLAQLGLNVNSPVEENIDDLDPHFCKPCIGPNTLKVTDFYVVVPFLSKTDPLILDKTDLVSMFQTDLVSLVQYHVDQVDSIVVAVDDVAISSWPNQKACWFDEDHPVGKFHESMSSHNCWINATPAVKWKLFHAWHIAARDKGKNRNQEILRSLKLYQLDREDPNRLQSVLIQTKPKSASWHKVMYKVPIPLLTSFEILVFPGMLIYWSIYALFFGVLTQLLFKDKPITEPL